MGRQLGYPLSHQAALTAAAAAAAAGPGKARSSMNLGLLSGRSAITGKIRAVHATTLPRQFDHVLGPKNG